jgi:hypothetical protein
VAESSALLQFEPRSVEVEGAPRTVLVARLKEPMLLDPERLEELRSHDSPNRIDGAIVEYFEDHDKADLVVFDARGPDGTKLWGFGPELSDEQRMEVGFELLHSQLPMYRALAERGVGGLVGVGFGSFELAALQRGTIRLITDLAAELEDAVSARAIELEVDLWLMEHAASWTGLTIDEYLATKAAAEIESREAKRPDIEKQLSRLAKLAQE